MVKSISIYTIIFHIIIEKEYDYTKNTELLPKESGIYKIENLINKKVYIGQSKNIHKRYFSHHKSDCYNINSLAYNFQIYQAIRKYGEENFAIFVLELCPEEQLDEREIF